MKEFFHGWRRKAGCVTLVIALASMGMWIRSLRCHDMVDLPFGPMPGVVYQVESLWGRVEWGSSPQIGSKPPTPQLEWKVYPLDAKQPRIFNPYVSYRAAVCPLTLLSAYLILWKPREVK